MGLSHFWIYGVLPWLLGLCARCLGLCPLSSPGPELTAHGFLDNAKQVTGRIANSAGATSGIPLVENSLMQIGINRLQRS